MRKPTEIEARKLRRWRDYAPKRREAFCVHGHLECAVADGGWCENELFDQAYGVALDCGVEGEGGPEWLENRIEELLRQPTAHVENVGGGCTALVVRHEGMVFCISDEGEAPDQETCRRDPTAGPPRLMLGCYTSGAWERGEEPDVATLDTLGMRV